ncbi:hypothetical protein DQ04_07291020 [Trypanosoma grayi]|uniref:hypothetical protein n=1 Tax=Trypanosoma grayi TaxID=71804 RepID=UPI0004F3FE97|nr:hypothetical protein DQ04_07291020 [Trypanosoma grayi]KEG08393.1 hypothetical protein DQ04_07291020 [Trypanosoma grayi]
MLRKLHVPVKNLLAATVCGAPMSLFSSVRWERNKGGALAGAADENEEDFNMIFNDDFQFLDECFGEGGADIFDYIPEHEAALLGHEGTSHLKPSGGDRRI